MIPNAIAKNRDTMLLDRHKRRDLFMIKSLSQFKIEEVTDPAELAVSRIRQDRFARNLAWFEDHAVELATHHRGRCICIAGEELFSADTPQQALARARTAHPEDDGFFPHYLYSARSHLTQRRAARRKPAGGSVNRPRRSPVMCHC